MKFKLFKIKSKITLVPTKDNGYIMVNEELEKELMKGKGGGGGDGSLKEILLKFIDEQKKFNSEVKEFIVEQKAVNKQQTEFSSEVKEFMVEQKEFNEKIENRLENLVKKNKLKE
ncbi:MAG: hypothetical protein LBC44_01525 [Mycoplasmataceae bacterium]|jgi:hypothetical protein|nr:hypothetical protein [Mycoplasmataceae bacterium]